MRVLILTSLFHPEIAANAKRMTHLAEGLKQEGHDVLVITAFPYYSSAADRQKYRGKWVVRESYDGIPVIRTYTYCPRHYRSCLARLLCFLSFMLSSLVVACRTKERVDVVVTISPPFFSLFSAYVISRLKKASLVIDIQDIYPETLVALGFLKNRILIRLLASCERFFYRRADCLIAISDGFKKDFVRKGAVADRVNVVHNWADTDLFRHLEPNGLKVQYGLQDKFVIMFVGTIGFAQGLEHVIEAGRLVGREEPAIHFVFLGEGVEKERLQRRIHQYGLSNFTFIGRRPHAEIPQFLSMADVCLVHLRRNPLFEITIPCKTYEYLAAGKPVIMGVKGEALRVIEDGKCGVGVEPESPEDLARAAVQMYRDRPALAQIGAQARQYTMVRFSRDRVIRQYVKHLENCARGRTPVRGAS